MDFLVYFLIAFALSAALIPLFAAVSRKIGLLDQPGGRKKHGVAVPLVGGLVIFPLFIAMALWSGIPSQNEYYFLAAMALLLVIGALDDRFQIAAKVKFVVQITAAALICIGGHAYFFSLGDLFGFGPFGLNLMAIPFALTAAVLLVNAVNLMDGLDGLSGGLGLISLGWLALACVLASSFAPLLLLMILCGGLCGFLVYNLRAPWRKKASVFMGDSGSLALGLSLAWFSITLAKGDDPVIAPIAVAWILALPIWDICGQFARRVSRGRHPFAPDLHHFHHHLIAAGFSVGKATMILWSFFFVSGLIGIGGIVLDVPEFWLTYPWIAGLFIHIYLSLRPHRFRRAFLWLRQSGMQPKGTDHNE